MKRKIKLIKHRLVWKYEHTDPSERGFWFCMMGLAFSFILLTALGF